MPEEEAAALELTDRKYAFGQSEVSTCVGGGASSSASAKSADVVSGPSPTKSRSPPRNLLDDEEDGRGRYRDDDRDAAPSYGSPSKRGHGSPSPRGLASTDSYHWVGADGSTVGPASLARLKREFETRLVGANTLVFEPGLGPDWRAIVDVPVLYDLLAGAAASTALVKPPPPPSHPMDDVAL